MSPIRRPLRSEIELKLELSPDSVDAAMLDDLFGCEGIDAEQTSLYFDTPDHRLRKAGLSLRLRRTGSRRIQTVKEDDAAAGLFVRREWERKVPGDAPVLDDTTPVADVLDGRIDELGPIFTVENTRRLWTLRVSGAQMEAVLDRGKILACGRQAPVCEVELELGSGERAILFALARRIDAVAPVHLGVSSKAERGYRLLGPLPLAVRARPILLKLDMTAKAAFEDIVRSCLKQFRSNELLIEHGNAEALHEARVSLRRLRSALSIFRKMLADDPANRLSGELRWLAGELGQARDIDVLLERAGHGALSERLHQARSDAYASAQVALGSARARGAMIDLAEWLAIGGWHTGPLGTEWRGTLSREFASLALGRLLRRTRRRGRNLAKLDDEARHELRKSAKKLRYGAEFFRSLFPGKHERRRYKRFLAILEDLQDQLGALNDLRIERELFDRWGLAGNTDARRLVRPSVKSQLVAAAAASHAKLVQADPFWR